MNNKKIYLPLMTILLLGVSNMSIAQWCTDTIPESTPTVEFETDDNGAVIHLRTGLIWKRCQEGYIFDDGDCKRDREIETRYSWDETFQRALAVNQENFAGYNDWRVPNIKELASILEVSCNSPAINSVIFPRLTTDTVVASSTKRIGIYFENGVERTHTTYYLRLVRDQ